MYPNRQEFEQLLRNTTLDSLVEKYLFAGLPFSFFGRTDTYKQMLRSISRGLEVPQPNICVVGSARIGFSLAPHKFGQPFSPYSDIDIVIVSEELFDSSWLDILTNRHHRWSSLSRQTQDRLIEHQERHHIYYGYISPSFVAPALAIGHQWLTTFNRLSQIPFLASRPVSGRLYRTWDHAKVYHRWSLRRVRDTIVGQPQGRSRTE